MNQALLCKWCWRFANERDSLWRLVISAKFGEEVGGWNSRDIRGGFGSGLWKDIRKEWLTFSQNSVSSLGNGRRLGTLGAMILCCATPSPPCSTCRLIRMLGWQMFGIPQGRKGAGPQSFVDLLMIGRWQRWKGSFTSCTTKKLGHFKRIGCY